MKNKPKISVITVVYNGEKFLEETIKSVINQTYENIEYIIIDGGSTDGTLDIIKKYEDKITYWISESDKGIYDAMNKGIDLVTGDWINFMNAGDSFFDNEIIEFLFKDNEYPDIDFLYGDLNIKYENFQKMKKTLSLEYFWKGMPFSHQSVFIDSTFHKANKYNLEYKIASDFNFFYNAHNDNRKFSCVNKTISNILYGGLSDSNHLAVCKENYKIVTRDNIKIKYHIYYIYIYISVILKKIIKSILGNKITTIIKRLK